MNINKPKGTGGTGIQAGLPVGVVLRDGEPCAHRGCLSHISHPCEGCGRIGGHSYKSKSQFRRLQAQLKMRRADREDILNNPDGS